MNTAHPFSVLSSGVKFLSFCFGCHFLLTEFGMSDPELSSLGGGWWPVHWKIGSSEGDIVTSRNRWGRLWILYHLQTQGLSSYIPPSIPCKTLPHREASPWPLLSCLDPPFVSVEVGPSSTNVYTMLNSLSVFIYVRSLTSPTTVRSRRLGCLSRLNPPPSLIVPSPVGPPV